MDVFIYTFESLSHGLDEIEDALDECLEDIGEVTGTGAGKSGSNFDIEINNDDIEPSEVLAILRNALRPFNLPKSSRVEIAGNEYLLIQ